MISSSVFFPLSDFTVKITVSNAYNTYSLTAYVIGKTCSQSAVGYERY